MLAAVDLEYALLLRMQEESPVYQASREQWFIDEQKRMEKLRETLDREFTVFSQQPESPPAQPSEEHALPTIAVTDEQPHIEKPSEEEATTTSPAAQPQPQPSPSPEKQDEDDLGEYLESENEAEEEDVKEPAAATTTTTTTVPENKEEEEVTKQPEFEDEEELDESLLEEVGDVTEPEQTEEDYKLMETTAVNEEQGEKMDVDEQESTAGAGAGDTPLHLDTLEDHDMEEVTPAATETEPAELGQAIETTTITPPSIAEKEDGEVTSVTEEPINQEENASTAATIDMAAEESSEAPLDVATEAIDKSEQPTTSTTDAPTTTTTTNEDEKSTQVTEAASTDEITAMEEEAAAADEEEAGLIETPKDVLQGEPDSDVQTPQHDQTLSAEDELKEFAESPLPTTAEEKQDVGDTTTHADINTPSQGEEPETQVPMPDDAQAEEKEHEDVTLDTATPQNEEETIAETKESAESTTEAAQPNQDDLLLEEDDQELVQKSEAKEALDVEPAVQDDGVSTPMDLYIEEEGSGNVTESTAPETSKNVEADAQKVVDKGEQLLEKEEEEPLVNKENESIVDEKKEESLENKEDGSIEGHKEESPANKEDALVEEKQDEGLVDEKKSELNIENEPTTITTAKGEQVVEQQPIVEEPSAKEETPANVPETTADNSNNDAQPTVPTVTVVEEQEDDGDHSVVPVANAGAMDELHASQPQAEQDIDTPTHVEEDDTAIVHDDQQKKKEQPQQEDAEMQIGDAGQAQDNNGKCSITFYST